MSRIDDIIADAKKRAEAKDTTLARKVETADSIRSKYKGKPLRIRVPETPALLSGKPLVPLQVSVTWTPGEVRNSKSGGLTVRWGRFGFGGGGSDKPDIERFTIEQIANAPPPDINYVWFIDPIRGVQSAINWFCRLFGIKEVTMLDLYGSILWKASTGEESITLPLVTHPAAVAKTIKEYTLIIHTANTSDDKLEERMDRGR